MTKVRTRWSKTGCLALIQNVREPWGCRALEGPAPVSVYSSLTRTEQQRGSDLEGLRLPSRSKMRANLSLHHSFNKEEESHQNEKQESKIILNHLERSLQYHLQNSTRCHRRHVFGTTEVSTVCGKGGQVSPNLTQNQDKLGLKLGGGGAGSSVMEAPGRFRLVGATSRGPAVARSSTSLWSVCGSQHFQMLESDVGTVALESCLPVSRTCKVWKGGAGVPGPTMAAPKR